MTTIYSIGHSNRTLDELLALLLAHGIQTVVDVRAHPASSRYPQFSEASLRADLEHNDMVYHLAGRQLGGRRTPGADSRHIALQDDALRGYADHMDSNAFQKAATQLISLATRAPTAMLCAERDPDRCHRSLIADYLTLKGVRVIHLLSAGEEHEHQLSPLARRESAQLIYDRNASGSLPLG